MACLQANEEAWQLLVVDLLRKQGTGLGVLAGIVAALTNAASPDSRAACFRLDADVVVDKAAQVNEFLAYCAVEH